MILKAAGAGSTINVVQGWSTLLRTLIDALFWCKNGRWASRTPCLRDSLHQRLYQKPLTPKRFYVVMLMTCRYLCNSSRPRRKPVQDSFSDETQSRKTMSQSTATSKPVKNILPFGSHVAQGRGLTVLKFMPDEQETLRSTWKSSRWVAFANVRQCTAASSQLLHHFDVSCVFVAGSRGCFPEIMDLPHPNSNQYISIFHSCILLGTEHRRDDAFAFTDQAMNNQKIMFMTLTCTYDTPQSIAPVSISGC